MKTFSHDSGFTFEAPEHWVTPTGVDSLALGAMLGYLSAGQEEGRAREYSQATGNVLTLYSSSDTAEAGALLFVTYLELEDGVELTQSDMKALSDEEREEFMASARVGAEQTVRDLNESFLGFGTYEIDEIKLIDSNNLLCVQLTVEGNFTDETWLISVTVTCPIGAHFFRWETGYNSWGTERELDDAIYVSRSFRMPEQLGTQKR
ncbi:MAG: hypothetical protein NXH72_08950 [Hyphomonadaceae bacterium]|nr:hypothetical protein [Hyphomonadaceae bacterium]